MCNQFATETRKSRQTGNVRWTPENEAENALIIFKEGLKTLASVCSTYEEWTENTDPCAPTIRHLLYRQQ